MGQTLLVPDVISEILKTSEEFFGTIDDPEQIPATREALEKHIHLHPKSFVHKTDENNKLIGWIVVVPTSKKLAEEFLANRITERDLFDRTLFSETYEALYLCSAFVAPEHRRMNHALEMFNEALREIPCTPDPLILAWPISMEGEKFIEKFERTLGKQIKIKS